MLAKIKNILNVLNKVGFPIPLLRDPKSGIGSISYTMLFITFNLVLLGIIGKAGKFLDIDVNQALTLFGITSSLYFGRQLSGNNTTETKDNS
jgi:hypothetical protein